MAIPHAQRPRRRTPLEPVVDRLEGAAALDAPAKAVGRGVRGAIPAGALKDALSGTWLGHAVHPLLTDVVVGSLLSATILDLLGGDEDAAASTRLIGVGMAAALPTSLTGASDWADAEPADDGVRRAGLVHAACNTVALALYATSLGARRRGARGRATLLGLGGASALMVSGYLGGHLTLAKGVGADQTVFDPGLEAWTDAGAMPPLRDGEAARVVADETPVLLVKAQGELLAVHDRCSHRGCSLSEGEIRGEEVVCGCHGSRFGLRDGALLQGPATAPQPAFEAREHGGRLELRRIAGHEG